MRILCLDIGSKRIGVAVSDPLGWTAQGVGVIGRGKQELTEIARLCREYEPNLIVVGIPLDEQGRVGPAARKVWAFINKLDGYLKEEGVEVPIETWDESYSTAMAEERLVKADVSRARRKKVIDKMAAVVILEDYLQAHEQPAGGAEGAEG
jgi:putative Holliday junction resolvase